MEGRPDVYPLSPRPSTPFSLSPTKREKERERGEPKLTDRRNIPSDIFPIPLFLPNDNANNNNNNNNNNNWLADENIRRHERGRSCANCRASRVMKRVSGLVHDK